MESLKYKGAAMRSDLILIASADRNWGLGKDNQLLARISEDMKRFSQFTKGNCIIVGRKTLESFKDQKPLPDRINIVLTRDADYACEGVVIVHNLDELSNAIEALPEKVYVCGGEAVYRLLLPYCQKACITQIDAAFEADTWLANLDTSPEWRKAHEGEWLTSQKGVRFRYVDYVRLESQNS